RCQRHETSITQSAVRARSRCFRRAAGIVVVAPHSVVGVSMIARRRYKSGVALIPAAGGLWSFAGGYSDAKLVIRARLASGRLSAQTHNPQIGGTGPRRARAPRG